MSPATHRAHLSMLRCREVRVQNRGGGELCFQLSDFFLTHLEQVQPASPYCHPFDRLPQRPP